MCYNIHNRYYKDYIEFLTPNNEFKKNKDYDKKSQYFDPSSKTVALLNIYSKDDCGSCKNKEQVDLPFGIWNKLYGKEIYKIGKNEGNKSPGEFNTMEIFRKR